MSQEVPAIQLFIFATLSLSNLNSSFVIDFHRMAYAEVFASFHDLGSTEICAVLP